MGVSGLDGRLFSTSSPYIKCELSLVQFHSNNVVIMSEWVILPQSWGKHVSGTKYRIDMFIHDGRIKGAFFTNWTCLLDTYLALEETRKKLRLSFIIPLIPCFSARLRKITFYLRRSTGIESAAKEIMRLPRARRSPITQ